jgi:hypothetical protein
MMAYPPMERNGPATADGGATRASCATAMSDPRPGEHEAPIPRRLAEDAEANGEGTSPEGRRPVQPPAAPPPDARGASPLIWVLLVFVVLIALAYSARVFR